MTDPVGAPPDRGDATELSPEGRDASRRFARRVAVSAAAFGVAWVTLSDRLVAVLVRSEAAQQRIQTIKGVTFIVLSSVLLYVLVRSLAGHRERALHAERQAAERDAWIQALAQDADVGIALIDRDGRFVHLNDRLAEMNGVPAAAHVGRTIDEVLPNDVGRQVSLIHRRVLATGRAEVDVETEGRDPTDETRSTFWRSSYFPIRDRDERLVGLGINVRDVTEAVQEERWRREHAETLQTVIDHLPAMVAFLDADGRPQLTNREWHRVLGWTGDDLATVDALAAAYPDRDAYARALDAVERSDGHWQRYETTTRSGQVIPTEWAQVRLPDGRSLAIGLDLTHEVRRERALERSEQRYRLLVEMLPGVVYRNEIDAEDPKMTRCVYMSPRIVDLLGYTPEAWIADPDLWLRVVHPADRERVLATNDAADATGAATFEYRAIGKDGDIVWIHDEGVLVPGDDDHPGYWQGVMIDITAQRAADAGIHELAESLRSVFAAAPVAILVMDPDSVVRHWNPAAERIFGWTADEVIGRPFSIVPPDRWDEHVALRDRVLTGEGIAGLELKRRHKDGRDIDVELWTAPLRSPTGEVSGIVTVFEDVTERRRVEDDLLLRSEMLDNVSEAVIATDASFEIIYWNRGAELLYGWNAHEVLGGPVDRFVRPDVPERRGDEIRRSLVELGTWAGESGHVVRDGSLVPVESITVARERTDGSRFFLSVNRDVTERRAAEEALERRAAQQAAVASLGVEALESGDASALLEHAVATVAETLDVDLTAVMELDGGEGADAATLRLRAGVGWAPEEIGVYRLDRYAPSLAALALDSPEPVVTDDLAGDHRLPAPPPLALRGLRSGLAAVIHGTRRPYGVLQAMSRSRRSFSRDDVRFLQGVAALVGLALERSRADVALAEAEDRYRGLVERGPGVVYLHDPSESPAALTYVSPQVEQLFGYPRSRWTEDPRFWIGVIHEQDRERLVAEDVRAIGSDADLDIEYRIVRSDGEIVWVHDHATVIRDARGKPLFRQGLLVDVTERRRAEEDRLVAVQRQLRLATRLELLHAIDREVRSATTVAQICRATLERLRSLVPADLASVGVFDPRTGLLDFPAMVDRDAMDLAGPIPTRPDDVTMAMLRQEVLRIDDLDAVEADSPYLEGARRQQLRSVRAFAMVAEDHHVGTLILGARTLGAFGEEDDDVGREVASLLAIAIRQRQLRDALAERAEEYARVADERQQMLRRIVTAQEAERERVALELHDGLGQILTSISLFASDLEDEVPPASRARASRVNELVRRAIADSRRLVWSLRPPELERLGLVPALRRLVEETSTDGLTVDLHEEIGDLRIEPDAEAVVYRVVQEAVNNAIKHADASAISVLVRRRDALVSTIVEDNGRGFELEAVPPGRGLGLIGMRERAELVGGDIVIESAVDAGTRVRLEVPVGVMASPDAPRRNAARHPTSVAVPVGATERERDG